MRPTGHFISSLAGAGLVYSIFGDFISAVVFFASGFFIDLDHLFDYVREYGLKDFNFKIFCKACYESKVDKVFIIFHSYEFLLILWIFITVYKLNIIWIILALGLSIHLITDQFTNSAFAYTYFFIYRWIKHFQAQEIFLKRKIRD